MGMKYMLSAFNYPYKGTEKTKQTNWFLIMIIYLIKFSIKYDGVNLNIRK